MLKNYITIIFVVQFCCLSLAYGVQPDKSILAATNAEQYSYRYLTELYSVGDLVNLEYEIKQFYNRYPESNYINYVKYLDANLNLEAGNHTQAQGIYSSLMNISLPQSVLGELYLNYALSLSATNDYSSALNLLQKIDSEISEPQIRELANLQRADIQYLMGHYYSAEKAYLRAWEFFPNDKEIEFSLFSTYVKLNKDEEALAIISSTPRESENFNTMCFIWLEHKLMKEELAEFDSFVSLYNIDSIKSDKDITDVRIRRAVIKGDYGQIADLLLYVTPLTDQYVYYQALVYLNDNQHEEADSLLQIAVNDPALKVAIPAYLTRLKILYQADKASAIAQLSSFLNGYENTLMNAELRYTMGYFYYHDEEFIEAIKQLSIAKHSEMNKALSASTDLLIAESWYALGRLDMATDALVNFISTYPTNANMDRALFYLGYIHFTNKDYSRSKGYLQEIIEKLPSSTYVDDASFYLAEMDFYLANYNLALAGYLALKDKTPNNDSVRIRIAQINYYLGFYDAAASNLEGVVPSYDYYILKGNILLAIKNYASAIDQFQLAEAFTTESLRIAEAQSYRALTLYQMKRFKEASALYLKLSSAKESPETYLYLSAKSAYAARDYHQAIELFTLFAEQHPESRYFISSLSDIANSYYNMGNFSRAIEDWINILARFRNMEEFNEDNLNFVSDALMGLELCLKRVKDPVIIDRITELPDTFQSAYLRFELNLILLKAYADNEDWDDLIATAEQIRELYPERKTEDVDLLLASGLKHINQYEQAKLTLQNLYADKESNTALFEWALLEMDTQNYASAYEKLIVAFNNSPDDRIWLKLIECSEQLNYQSFDDIWDLGASYASANPMVYVKRLWQLYKTNRLDEAMNMAEFVLNNNIPLQDHATSFLVMGLIDIQKGYYPSAVSTLRRIVVLFPESLDIVTQAMYNIIKAYILNGSLSEAENYFLQYTPRLSAEQILELNAMLEERK